MIFFHTGLSETAGFQCSVLIQPTTVLAFSTQREGRGRKRERSGAQEKEVK